ncbi:hypothetical protein F2P45_15660 [Massilia sp. CCM 8733]|uniref:Tetratricopeptide repeat protein n=1 Tax=Massilia mucilaginosa TaxID=2609282 RepID=A0ABX0NU27_9BURK|nr:hypothetical protein [Massilia mucilaginosa]NHZ90444.1 hypothetical protein [Massilia mucilaginosa]
MEQLKETYIRACQLVVQGNYPDALEAFVWLHDNPMPDEPISEVFRRACGFQAWGLLGRVYAPAAEKMHEILSIKIVSMNKGKPDKAVESDILVMKGILATINNPSPDQTAAQCR